MNANDVVVDLLNDNVRRLHRVIDGMDEDCLYRTPDPEANSIAVTVWHMARVFDVFLNQHVQGKEATNEVWFSGGWAERTGYDPRGIGRDGWGSVNGYTREEVAAIPHLSREELLDYIDEVKAEVSAFLARTSIEELLREEWDLKASTAGTSSSRWHFWTMYATWVRYLPSRQCGRGRSRQEGSL